MILADHARDLIGRTVHISFAGRPDDFYAVDLAHVAEDGLVGTVGDDARLRLVPFKYLAMIEEA